MENDRASYRARRRGGERDAIFAASPLTTLTTPPAPRPGRTGNDGDRGAGYG
ncbi:hypothetical protein [Actinopolymorpha rutila]|uniref:Uncharacterized protein n=1 Tax=Actinopolymorpha rutila TaxID=446787 RepID=A0A852ZH64_9ACTN|nr:hypothetical protein [Actinopolymorpha rutila]NYH88390.1 hypothetical protein [Actinopolymorpha rutila]